MGGCDVSYRRHGHDELPGDYPITMQAIQLAERLDDGKRSFDQGLIDEAEMLLAFSIWQVEFQRLAAAAMSQVAISIMERKRPE